jgi:hypothetical protein
MQVDAPVLFAGGQRFIAHAALANDAAHAEVANDLPLIGFLANGRGRAGGDAFPIALFVFNNHRAAMVQNPAFQADSVGKLASLVKILVNCIAAGEKRARDGNLITDFEFAYGGFG